MPLHHKNGSKENTKKRLLSLFTFIVTSLALSSARPAEPTSEVEIRCLLGKSIAKNIRFSEIDSHQVFVEDDYANGYAAVYILRPSGTDIGYAEKGNQQALIYNRKLYPLTTATRVLGTTEAPSDFTANLALWSTVREDKHTYLCVSFNFDGVGRSGQFQKTKGAYMLSMQPLLGKAQLFYMAGNTEKYGH